MLAVAVSGGVDSLYALYRQVREHGADNVLAVHGRFFSATPDKNAVPGLLENCAALGVRLVVLDAVREFDDAVIRPFARSYAAGHTPNPCALCNARIKFGLVLDAARNHGASRLATGHYARLVEHPVYGLCLGAAQDQSKDQSYFLALVPRERLSHLLFPLAERRKTDIRAELTAAGLRVPLPVESQEICFVPGNDYRTFLHARGVALSGPGPILLADSTQILGRHKGLWRYTEGQRRGLGIAWSEPLYVTGKNTTADTLFVGPREALRSRVCTAKHVNVLVPPDHWPERLFARVRYRQVAAPAQVTLHAETLHIVFDAPQDRAASGQLLVVTDAHGHVLAGGILGTTCD